MRIFNEKEECECPDPFKDKVKCDECRCWIDKKDAQKVEYYNDGYCGGFYPYHEFFYCQSHKKPYSKKKLINTGTRGTSEQKVMYFGEVEMDENGNPIKK